VGSDGVGGGKYASSHALADHLKDLWTAANQKPLVVFTGGEPLLQLDSFLIQDVQARGFEVAVETNGTIQPPAGINWLTVSPKGSVPLRVRTGQELKLVYPQFQSSPETFECLAFEHFFLQPLDDDDLAHHTRAAVDYCLGHPKWRLSVQMHKFAGFR
jgi:7-carboxy-7-deazaguanine synthase (Cx14CxxC type)